MIERVIQSNCGNLNGKPCNDNVLIKVHEEENGLLFLCVARLPYILSVGRVITAYNLITVVVGA